MESAPNPLDHNPNPVDEYRESFHCRECGRDFSARSKALDHLSTSHCGQDIMAAYESSVGGVKSGFRCGLCGKDMFNRFSLMKHLGTVHQFTSKKVLDR